ncbi:ester cyclase [Pseudonocardia acaciae]|uniref:ester cyclase n=1 Tax=Pseudonocardia acaciae TaxID=551276 RepID=UPI00048C5F37|nr:ester cyclase [Pseudonocardia acaciae]
MNGTETTAGDLARRAIDLINTRRPDLAAEIFAEDFVMIDPHGHDHAPEGSPRGPAVFANIVGYLHRIFDDLRVEVTDSYDAGDRAAVVVDVIGNYRGTPESPGRGQPVRVEQVHLWRARDGRLAWHRFVENDAELERQLA